MADLPGRIVGPAPTDLPGRIVGPASAQGGAEQPQDAGALSALWGGLIHEAGNVVASARQLGSRIPGMSALTGETPQAADAAAQQREREYRGPFAPGPGQPLTPARQHPIASGIGEFLGGAAATAPLAMATGGTGLAARAGTAALAGGVAGATNPVVSGRDFWTEKATQTGLGAAAG